jgi:hypothetical protein
MRIDAKRKIPQDLGPEAIAQSYVLEPDHLPLPKKRAPSGGTAVWRPASTRPYSSERAVRPLPLLHVLGRASPPCAGNRLFPFQLRRGRPHHPGVLRLANSLTHARWRQVQASSAQRDRGAHSGLRALRQDVHHIKSVTGGGVERRRGGRLRPAVVCFRFRGYQSEAQSAPPGRSSELRNPAAAARCSRARAAGGSSRRSAGAILPECAARAARRSRLAP